MRKIVLLTAALFAMFASEAQIKREQPKPGPVPSVNVSKPKEFTLKNGLKVMVVEDNKLPRVSYVLTIDTPPYTEGNKVGVSGLTSAVVGNGTTKTPKDKFNDEIDFLGANIGFSNTSASGSGLSKYSERILELMAEGALHPLFTQEEFDKVKAQAIEGLKSNEKSATAIASRVEDAVLFGKNHPNGEFETEESINNITLADVKKNYAEYFVPEQAYLIVIGDVKFDKVKKQVEKLFNGWKKASAPKSTYAEPKNVGKTEINFVDVPNAVQSEISIVNLTDLKMTDKDYFATLMANQILGGGGEGRLFLNLREAHGWTYGSYSSIRASKYTSKFRAQASVRNTVTDSAVVELMKEISKIRTTPVTEEELQLAKAKYIGSFVMEIQKPGTVAAYALRTKTQNLPADFYENFIKNINAVTIKDVQSAANKYFLENNFRIVIAGKATEVLSPIEKLGYPINYFDRYATPTTKPEGKKEVSGNVTAQSVVQKYFDAIGGLDKVKAVTTISTTSKGSIQGMEVTKLDLVDNKNQYLMSISAQGMEFVKVLISNKEAYQSQQGQKMPLEGEDLAEAKNKAVPFAELSLLNDGNIKLDGIENINGKDAYAVVSGKSTYYFDVASGFKIAEKESQEAEGQTFEIITNFGDYKEVKGIQFPHSTTLNVGMEIELKVSEIKVNEGVSDADFK